MFEQVIVRAQPPGDSPVLLADYSRPKIADRMDVRRNEGTKLWTVNVAPATPVDVPVRRVAIDCGLGHTNQLGRTVDDEVLWLILILAYHALIGLTAAAVVGVTIWGVFLLVRGLLPRRFVLLLRSYHEAERSPFLFRLLRGLLFVLVAGISGPSLWLIAWYFLVYLRWDSEVHAWDQFYVGLPVSVFFALLAVVPGVLADAFMPPRKKALPVGSTNTQNTPGSVPSTRPCPLVAVASDRSLAARADAIGVFVIDGVMLAAASLVGFVSLAAKGHSEEDLQLMACAATAAAAALLTIGVVRSTSRRRIVWAGAGVTNLVLLFFAAQSWLRAFENRTQLTPTIFAWLLGGIVLFNLLTLAITAGKFRCSWRTSLLLGGLCLTMIAVPVVIWLSPRWERFQMQYQAVQQLNGLSGRNAVVWRNFWVTQVFLYDTAIDDLQVQPIFAFPHLQDLDLSKTVVSDAGLQRLSSLRDLRVLILNDTRVTDETMKLLPQLTKLTSLYLKNTAVTDDGLAHVVQLPELWYLNLQGTKVTDCGVSRLKQLPKLSRVELQRTQVSEAAVKELKQAKPSVWIDGPSAKSHEY